MLSKNDHVCTGGSMHDQCVDTCPKTELDLSFRTITHLELDFSQEKGR